MRESLSHFRALKGITEEKPHEYAQCGGSIHLLHFLLMPKEKATMKRKLMNASNVVKLSLYFSLLHCYQGVYNRENPYICHECGKAFGDDT